MLEMVPDIQDPYTGYMGAMQGYTDVCTCLLINPTNKYATTRPRKMRRSILHFAKRLWSSEDTNSRRMICDSCKNDPITRKTLCKKCIRKSTVCSTCYNQLMNTKSGDLKRRSSDKWNSSPMVHSYTESDIPNIKPFDNRTLPNTSSNTDACRSNTDKLLKLKSVNTSIEEDQSPTDTSIETYHTPICKSISFDFSFSGGIGTNNISRGKYSSSSEEYVSCSEDKIDNRTSYIQSKNSTPQGLNNQSKNSKSSLRSSKSSLRSSKHSINNSYESIASLAVSTISVEKGGISVERPKGGLTRKAFVSPVHRPSITRCNAVEIEDEEMSVVKVKHSSMSDEREILLPHLTEMSIKKLALEALHEETRNKEIQVEAKHLSLLCEEVLSECEEEEEGPVKRSVKINEEENEEYSRPCSLQSLELQHPTVEETPAYYVENLQTVVSVSMQKSEKELKRSLSVASTTRLQRKLSKRLLAPIPVQKQASPDGNRPFLRKKYDSESSYPGDNRKYDSESSYPGDNPINLSKSGMRECDVKMFGNLYMERLEQEIRAIAVLKEIENKNNITFRDRLKGALDQHEQLAADLENVRKELRECMESYRCLSETFV